MKTIPFTRRHFKILAYSSLIATVILQSSCKQKQAEAVQITSPLKTAAQLSLDSLAINLINDIAIKNTEKELVKTYTQDPAYNTPDGKATLEQDIHGLAYAAVEETIINLSSILK